MATDESSFFLYGMGENPEALTLGSLVLEKYWQPTLARHYTHELLSDEALAKHAYSTVLTDVVFHGRSRLTPGVGLDGGDIVNLNLAYNKDLERVVVADKGTRVVLKDPEAFLTNQVLRNELAQQKLKLWLSAANSTFVLNFKFARRPKVWMLTGLYLLEGTRTAVSHGKSVDLSTGISSALVGALSGVPIGASVKLGVGSSWEMAMQVAEPHVWAAQFRLVDAKFIKVGKGGIDDVKLPAVMGLYRDVMSVRRSRKTESEENEGKQTVELKLESDEPKKVEEGHGLEQDDQAGPEVEEYEKYLERAIKFFEMTPDHLRQ
ncbi:hypothetical protein N7468_003578 [Penicillium chermesinum]|uniref:Uncharacterized protein n=1 Tax=Penicillium chermesinum TaxID=63820 RepID=A0A9W9TTI1_9EURO|nr:uncharacterized protein N7468_003578 [Penicillium chermesinum]KAJ5238959.1 hypothetical protein N7468_003578 [Penicillium chermesinum]KAJ6164602.1 hypothetical protein N7470_003274 [Penicillium chermesinum]